jgi:hypothetical protein
MCDNTTAVAYLRKEGGTKSLALCQLSWEILHFCNKRTISLQIRHIPSKLNVLADALSRTKPLLTEWKLNRGVFLDLLRLVPNLSVDLFATRKNTRLPLFLSPFPDPLAQGVDALTDPWTFPGILYAFPPTPVMQALLNHVRAERRTILLIAPWWPKQPWFTDLLELSVTHALRLPLVPDLLCQSHWIHPSPMLYHLHAWMLSGQPWQKKDILTELPSLWLSLCGPRPAQSTTQNGQTTLIGVNRDHSIHSVLMDPSF